MASPEFPITDFFANIYDLARSQIFRQYRQSTYLGDLKWTAELPREVT